MFTEDMIREALDAKGFVYEHTNTLRHGGAEAQALREQQRKELAEVPEVKRFYRRSNIVRQRNLPLAYEALLREACRLHGGDYGLVICNGGDAPTMRARAHFVAEMKERTGLSNSALGRMLGREHSYVIYYVRRWNEMKDKHADKVKQLKEFLP